MAGKLRGAHFGRDDLPNALTQFGRQKIKEYDWHSFVNASLSQRGGGVGSWNSTLGDPLAEVLIVHDNDYAETISWLNAFFAPLSPITQWCRVLRLSQADQIAKRTRDVGLDRMLSAWVGAILAECSVQAGGIQSLKDFPGSAAASSATFAGGRATSVWGDDADLVEIAQRHDDLTSFLLEGVRPIKAVALVPLWSVLNGYVEVSAYTDRRSLEPFVVIFRDIVAQSNSNDIADIVQKTSISVRENFDIPEVTECAEGPQVERVRALDRLGDRLSQGPHSPAIDALLGLGASFIDPGAAVSPELLRKHVRQFPLSPIWQGAFAGALNPFRVLIDQSGLGRLVAKLLLAPDDLHNRPSCDISYDELARRLQPGRQSKIDIRGMSPRIISVELTPGVTCNFPQSRAEATQNSSSRVEDVRHSSQNDRSKTNLSRTQQDMNVVINSLLQRVERLEEMRLEAQSSFDLRDNRDSNTKRSNRTSTTKNK